MLKIWQVRCPSAVDPVNIWDDVCSNRHLYLKKLEKEIINKDEDMEIQTSSQELSGNSLEIDEPESEDFKKVALETQVYVKLHFAETS
ncbi:DNA-dependent protein kinase catalytic subunit, partial [Stegodyphus mimosarum]